MPPLQNKKHELFAQYYAGRCACNGIKSYCMAYNLNHKNPKDWETAHKKAYRVVAKVGVQERINELMADNFLTDERIRQRIAQYALQGEDTGAALTALKLAADIIGLTKGNSPTVNIFTNFEDFVRNRTNLRDEETTRLLRDAGYGLRSVPQVISGDQGQEKPDDTISCEYSSKDIRGETERPGNEGRAYPGFSS